MIIYVKLPTSLSKFSYASGPLAALRARGWRLTTLASRPGAACPRPGRRGLARCLRRLPSCSPRLPQPPAGSGDAPGPPSAGGLQGAERPRSRGVGTRPWGDVVGAGCALLPESSGRPGGQLALPSPRQRFRVALPPQTGRRRSFVHLAGRGLPDGTR